MQFRFGLGLARSDTDVKRKWKDLLSKAKKDVSDKKVIVQSEGAQLLKLSVFSDIVLDVFGEDSPAITGSAGVESGSAPGSGLDSTLLEKEITE